MTAAVSYEMLMDSVSPRTKKDLVAERLRAMRGQLSIALENLKKRVNEPAELGKLDRLAMRMLSAELLHLDGLDQEAFDLLQSAVVPQADSFSPACQFALSDNVSTLQAYLLRFDEEGSAYHLTDRRRQSHFEWSDTEDTEEADYALDENSFSRAVAPLWRNVVRAYTVGSWHASRLAAARYGRLCLNLGALDEACHFLIAAENDKEWTRLADLIAQRRDIGLVRAIVRRVTAFANLQRHFIVAAKMVAEISEFVPDEDVPEVAEWLLPRCRMLPIPNGGGAMRAAWETLESFGHRLPSGLALRAIDCAKAHRDWLAPPPGENRVLVNRKGIIDAVCSLVTAIPQSEMDTLVEAAIPLATDRKQDYDYTSAVGLLYRVATVGGDAIKRRLAAALYPSGRADNRILASVYETFGVAEPLTLEQWENLAERVVAETRQTVQRLGPDDTPLPVPETLMTSHRDTPSGRLHVAMHGTVGLESLAKKRSVLSKGAVAKIVEVLIEMSTDKDNLPTNRQRLISVLAKFADTADDRLSKSVFAALEPLAQGDGIASSEQPSAAAAAIGGDSEDVQAAALVTLAAYAGAKRDRLRQVNQALFQALVHPNEKIRKAAYVAAAKLSKISREGMLALLNGLRDPEPSAARTAFQAFAMQAESHVTASMWRIFLLATRFAAQSSDVNLRYQAATALRKQIGRLPTTDMRVEGEAILDAFRTDIAFGVRRAVTSPVLDGENG